jgi:hypothetical protein
MYASGEHQLGQRAMHGGGKAPARQAPGPSVAIRHQEEVARRTVAETWGMTGSELQFGGRGCGCYSVRLRGEHGVVTGGHLLGMAVTVCVRTHACVLACVRGGIVCEPTWQG